MRIMKLITLNTWGGRAGNENLLNFFRAHKDGVDIFCLQEIWSAPYDHLEGASAGGKDIQHNAILVYGKQEISRILSDYQTIFHPHHLDNYGLISSVKKSIPIKSSGDVFVHKDRGFVPLGDVGHHARNIQYVTFTLNAKTATVINFHGLWNGKGKTDSEDRIEQSKKIIEFLKEIKGEVVLCGDFNLLPDTESIKMFEEYGFRNLISEYRITSTRTALYTKQEKFADYIFVSNGIHVNEFKVLPDVVSDHSPLFIDFE
jgi:endonuclease/exonuclease/phosphatase family metal-dependent hydrolase